MIDGRYFIEPAVWSVDADDLKAVRTEVFIEEQSIPENEEWDADDALADHALARTPDGQAIGTGRLTLSGYIGRMAVIKAWRGEGVGEALLRHLIERAAARGLRHLKMHAQTYAIPFYARSGFRAEGPEFIECGIPHQTMVLDLPEPESLPVTKLTPALAAPQAQPLKAERAGELREATLALLRNSRHQICIYSRDLEPSLYQQPEVLEAIRQIALSGRRAQIRILVQITALAVRDGHRLLDLAQRLSSVVQLRQPVQEDLQFAGAYLLNDTGGYLYRSFGDRFEAMGDLYYPLRRDELQRSFDQVWERAITPPELRRLAI